MNTNALTKTVLFASICVMLSCSSSNKITVTNVYDSKVIPGGSFIYGLPQTVIDIAVVASEVITVPGPYYEYAEKYLSIEHAPGEEQTAWSVSDIRLSLHTEADPDLVYSIEGMGSISAYPELEKLVSDSLILFPADFTRKMVFYQTLPAGMEDIHYFDLSVKRNFDVEDSDVEVSLVLPGPDREGQQRNSQAVEKMLEQKAEEAANFIIKLRKRRFKLVAGQYDYMPEGQAMAEALAQLNKTEEEYLALFIGRRIKREHTRTFHFIPSSDVETERSVLFRFSETDGFIDARESNGIPVMIELTNSMKTGGLAQAGISARQKDDYLIYRIPDLAVSKVLYGERLIVDAYLPVCQYGKVVTLQP